MDSEREQQAMRAVEALIFAADEPVKADQIAGVVNEVSPPLALREDVVHRLVEQLNASYEDQGRAFRIQFWAGGFRMTTSEEVAPFVEAFLREHRNRKLSVALMETLAIISYRQPATKPEISQIRGVASDYALRRLLEAGLIDIVGRADSLGRPVLYGTTDLFLEAFGLADLSQLPNIREVEELLQDPSFSQEKARQLMFRGLNGADG